MNNNEKELTFTLTVEEVNLVLEALGKEPFNKVFQLIGKVQQQASAQLQQNGAQESNGKNADMLAQN